MKKLRFLFLAVSLFYFSSLIAQNKLEDNVIPVDDKVITGQLENGFRYYIRSNKKPEKRVEIRLAVNAGSILETDEQQGLAHFVEHMCFNGTKHFEKNDLIKYLESAGVKFGPDLNAYTSFDETVYMLTIPSDSTHLIEDGFLVMEDWAHNVTFEDEEIDKERGVIIEEWRMGRGPNQRMRDKFLPVLFKDSKYAERLPIGTLDILENFEHQTIRNFYKDWYRPDLMALAVVGDIDVELAEKKIKEHFGNIKMPENPKKREIYSIPDNDGTLVCLATDKEAPYSVIRLFYKRDSKVVKTEADYLNSLRYSFIGGMLSRRLAELKESATPPFIAAGAYYGGLWARGKDAFQGYAVVGENGIELGLQTLMEENIRMKDYGFTQGELDRYKLDYMKRMERAYKERDKTESDNLVSEYVRNYLEDEPIPGIEYEYEFAKKYLDKITLKDINELAASLITESNRVVVVTGPEKDGLVLPTEDEILKLTQKYDLSEVKPYEDKIASAKLMDKLPKPGTIIKETKLDEIDGVELELSNGAKVILKPTDFKNDEIRMSAFAWGGTSVYDDKDHFSAIHAAEIIKETGISDFSPTDLSKVLAGKSAYVGVSIGTETQNVSANCRVEDTETMMQLLYLYFTDPRVDKEAFQSYITKNKDLYKNLAQEPMNYFYDKYNRIRCQNHPRGNYLPLEEDWDKINYKRVVDIYKDRYANAAEFTFIFVGTFEIEDIKPFITKYIASLPSKNRKETYRDLGIRPPKGKVVENVYKGTDKKSLAIIQFTKDTVYNEKDAFLFSQLAQHLRRKYYEKLREEMSGVYGVGASATLSKVPYGHATLNLKIPCSPDNVDSLINAAIHEIVVVRENGVSDEDINKLREIYKRDKEKNLEENNYWLNSIRSSYIYGKDLGDIASFDMMNEITSENLQRIAKKYINLEEYLQVVLYPEEFKDK